MAGRCQQRVAGRSRRTTSTICKLEMRRVTWPTRKQVRGHHGRRDRHRVRLRRVLLRWSTRCWRRAIKQRSGRSSRSRRTYDARRERFDDPPKTNAGRSRAAGRSRRGAAAEEPPASRPPKTAAAAARRAVATRSGTSSTPIRASRRRWRNRCAAAPRPSASPTRSARF